MNTEIRHNKTLLVIIAEAAIEKPLIQDARERGAHGWTVGDVRGGSLEAVRDGAWEADRTIELKVICDAVVADAIADHVLQTYVPHYAVAMYLSEVRVLRPERF